MKNLIFLTGSYYPKASATGNCIYNIVSNLESDYNITVISNITTAKDTNKVSLNKHTVIRFFTNEMLLDLSANKYIKYLNKIKRYIRVHFTKYSINRRVINSYYSELKKIDNIDAIFCTCLPFESLYAAYLYKNEINNNVKIFPILIDKFADSDTLHRTLFNKKIKFNNNLNLERLIINESTHIFMIKSWLHYFKNYFNENFDKVSIIELPLIKNNICKCANNNKRITIMYSGALLEGYVEPNYFFDMLYLIDNSSELFDLHFYINEPGKKMIERKKRDLHCKTSNWILQKDLEIELMKADYLLSISEKKGIQVSSKIFTYMSTGKPIIHIYFDENDVNLHYLKKYNNCLLINANGNINENSTKLFKWCSSNINIVLEYKDIIKNFETLTSEYVANQLASEI